VSQPRPREQARTHIARASAAGNGRGAKIAKSDKIGKFCKCLPNFGGIVPGCVSKPLFPSKYAFCRISQALQDLQTFAPLQTKIKQKHQLKNKRFLRNFKFQVFNLKFKKCFCEHQFKSASLLPYYTISNR